MTARPVINHGFDIPSMLANGHRVFAIRFLRGNEKLRDEDWVVMMVMTNQGYYESVHGCVRIFGKNAYEDCTMLIAQYSVPTPQVGVPARDLLKQALAKREAAIQEEKTRRTILHNAAIAARDSKGDDRTHTEPQ